MIECQDDYKKNARFGNTFAQDPKKKNSFRIIINFQNAPDRYTEAPMIICAKIVDFLNILYAFFMHPRIYPDAWIRVIIRISLTV